MKNADHIELGKKLDLFHIEKCSPGSVFWHPKGLKLFREIENFLRKICEINEYQEIKTPLTLDKKLWEKSKYWSKLKENISIIESSGRESSSKLINCLEHIQVFKNKTRNYKDLPLRYMEFGLCSRDEFSDELHNLRQLTSFTQDYGHIFCEEDDMQEEIIGFCELVQVIYHHFGFENIKVKFSNNRPNTIKCSDEDWTKAENALKYAIQITELDYETKKDEELNYGPKIEFILTDIYGREWQFGTLQVDFTLAKLLNVTYLDEYGTKKNPIILHRNILGNIEQFIAILLEQNSGNFPFWLTPIQFNVLTISEKFDIYGDLIKRNLRGLGYRAKLDNRLEKINKKIRDSIEQKIPVMVIIGQKEVDNDEITIRIDQEYETISRFELENYIKQKYNLIY